MRIKYFILFSAVFFKVAIAVFAQERLKDPKRNNNIVKLATASVHIPCETGSFRPFSQVGIYYERKIVGNWAAGVGYMQWLKVPNGRDLIVPEEGVLAFKDYYKMADLYILYRQKFGKAHMLNAGLGLTYTFGTNYYYRQVQTFGFGDNLIPLGDSESFWGAVPQMSYSYCFLSNRLRIGADFRLRYYFNRVRPQYEPGAHIGFMF